MVNVNPPRQNENQPLVLEFETDVLYTYKLYFWLFNPSGVSKKFSSVVVFDRNGVADSNLFVIYLFNATYNIIMRVWQHVVNLGPVVSMEVRVFQQWPALSCCGEQVEQIYSKF